MVTCRGGDPRTMIGAWGFGSRNYKKRILVQHVGLEGLNVNPGTGFLVKTLKPHDVFQLCVLKVPVTASLDPPDPTSGLQKVGSVRDGQNAQKKDKWGLQGKGHMSCNRWMHEAMLRMDVAFLTLTSLLGSG